MLGTFSRGLQCLLTAVLAFLPLSSLAEAQGKPPLIVVSVASVDHLLGDLNFLAQAGGGGETGRQIVMLANALTARLQKDKPIGLHASILENGQPSLFAFLPVKDLPLLLATLKDQVGEPKEVDGGLLEIASDKPMQFYLKQKGGWVFASETKQNLQTVPDDPTALLDGLHKKYALAVRVNVHAIPQETRNMAVTQMRQGFAEGMKSRELDLRSQLVAEKLGKNWLKMLEMLVQDAGQVTLGLDIDAKTRKTMLEAELTALEGSALASQFAPGRDVPSSFAGFLSRDHAASLHLNFTSTSEDIDSLLAFVALVREVGLEGLDKDGETSGRTASEREKVKAIYVTLMDVLKESVKTGKVNGGAALDVGPDSVSFVAGGFVADGDKLSQGLRDLNAMAKTPFLKIDPETYHGITLHSLKVPLPNQYKVALGDPMHVVLGTGKQAFFLAMGKNAEVALKKVIDASKDQASRKTLPAEVVVAMKPVLQFSLSQAPSDPNIAAALRELTGSEADRITLTATRLERGIGVRLSIDEGILKVFAAITRLSAGAPAASP